MGRNVLREDNVSMRQGSTAFAGRPYRFIEAGCDEAGLVVVNEPRGQGGG